MRYDRVIAVIAAVLTAGPAAAQELNIPPARIPTIPTAVPSLESLVPAGWKMETKAFSDLNGDGVTDVATVLRGAYPRLVVANSGFGPDRLNTNPRILLVAFGTRGGGYRVVVQNSTLIPRHTVPTMDDPFDSVTGGGLEVRGRSIRVELGSFMNAGGWGMYNVTYTFRWQNERLEMIGYDRNAVQRNTGEMWTVSVNYSTRKAKLSHGHISDERETFEWRTLSSRRRYSIDEIGDGLEFDAGFRAD